MAYATATIADADEYQRLLSTPHPVFMLFVSERCSACAGIGPLFVETAAQYPQIRSLVLDCANTPRHPLVTGTPTLLIYSRGTMMETLKYFGPEDKRRELLQDTFKRYAPHHVAKTPASPAVPPPPPPSNANPHAPGSRPPRVDDRAGSSPVPPSSGNPQ